MTQDPCAVCGGNDLKLIDGYYYCVECGTQDTTARETVVEHAELADGTLGYVFSKKINTTIKDGIEMSPEWTKWHTFNFILSGLADELIALGADPEFKTKLLWVWTRFMKEFHIKDDVLSKSHLQEFYKDESENVKKSKSIGHSHVKNPVIDKFGSTISFHLLISLIYVALNLERSDILLSHLQRFLVDGHLSSTNCTKYVPKDLNTHTLPKWSEFCCQCSTYQQDFDSVKSTLRFRMTAMSAFKKLNLGTPLVPDLRKIVNDCIKELCLPNEFENLVYSLLELAPLDQMSLDDNNKKEIVRIPDYEGMVMAYILVALKMCFGLDDHYEIQLSNEIDKINSDSDHPKSYKIGSYSDLTDRLFCFREWCNFLQFRKVILSKYYLPIAEISGLEADDYLFMEQTKERSVKRKTLFEEITMEIIDRLPLVNDYPVIPKSEFIPTLTPMTTYTQVILQYLQDPDLKLLFSEDFTRYSLKYACLDLKLPMNQNSFQGVTEENFTVGTVFKEETCGSILDDPTMVFVKNCENKNWLTTKPPKKEHVIKIEYDSDRDSLDYGYDSNEEITDNKKLNISAKSHEDISIEIHNGDSESLQFFSELFDETDTNTKPDMMYEEDESKCIFDDDFADLESDCKKKIVDNENSDQLDHNFESNTDNQVDDRLENIFDPSTFDREQTIKQQNNTDNQVDDTLENIFDPSTFDREQTIKQLVLAACEEYKIPIPIEYKPVTRKRKTQQINDEALDIDAKKRRPACETHDQSRPKPGEAKKEVDRILTAYYAHLDMQLRINVSENIQDVRPEFDETLNSLDNDNNPDINDDFISFNDQAHGDNNGTNINEVVNIGQDAADSSCILEGTVHNSDDELDSFLLKGDPKYNDRTHDIRQLYLKFKDNMNINDIVKPDELIEKIINKQLEGFKEICDDNNFEKNAVASTEKCEDYSYWSDSSEDNITLKQLKQRLDPIKPNEPCTEVLIKRDTDIKCFNYWMRTYPPRQAFKTVGINTRFDQDLEHKFPKSFNFLINECAMIINSTPYMLYKNFQMVEERLAAVKAPYDPQ